jgi:hypothetical protein
MFEQDDRIDFEESITTYQIKGTLHLVEKPMNFNANVFKDICEEEYLVEFQRQSGCPHDFQAFYRQCHAHFKKLGLLVVPVTVHSVGIFNFTSDSDGVAVALATGFDANKGSEYMNRVTAAINYCSSQFSSKLVDVRNEALRSLVLATDELKPFVFNDTNTTVDTVLGILCSATKNHTHVRGINKEMVRCLSAIASNLCCDKPEELIKEEDRRILSELKNGIHERLVPILLSFWDKPSSDKCEARNREADKQIVRLLGILYNNRNHLCEREHKEKMEKKKLNMIKKMDNRQYKRMSIALQKTIDTLLLVPIVPTRSDNHFWNPLPANWQETIARVKVEETEKKEEKKEE